ncbi:P4HA [Lepeophtheirus salmonis]|uniref:procollagen-proline 4-dioxygenase n=1 Tax=Lepeophtheirus salmonis TaxID=72036 RepID=A0A7R8CLC2_LEPSM|nr:P4HA [Lepeophtheirus salmonis]CAF2854179.1 P4HA [Lepeophtheirus salmonis]
MLDHNKRSGVIFTIRPNTKMYSGSSLPYSKFIVDLHKTTYKSSGNHLKGWDRMPKKMLPTLKRNSDAVPWGVYTLGGKRKGNWLKVRSIRSDTPAYEAGIRSGDFITRNVLYLDVERNSEKNLLYDNGIKGQILYWVEHVIWLVIEAVFFSNAFLLRLRPSDNRIVERNHCTIKDMSTRTSVIFVFWCNIFSRNEDGTKDYLNEVETSLSDKSELDTSDDDYFERISENPIHAYKLVKRFSVDWKKLEPEVIEDDWPELELKIHKKKLSTIIPKEQDLHGSAQALLRISDVYDLDVRNLSEGIIENRETSAKLSAKDCLFMGKHSFNSGELSRSLEWFEQAWLLAGQKPNLTATTLSRDEPVHESSPFEQRDQLRMNVPSPRSEEDMFKSLCRGEEHREPQVLANMKCYTTTKTHPYYLLHPVMVEEVNHDPHIVVYYDVISSNEMKVIKELAEPYLMRSQVQSETYSEDSFHPIVSKMSFKVNSMTGLNSDTWKEDAELLQIANYINGGHYQPHHDYVIKGVQPDKMIYGNKGIDYYIGDRIATWMVYMNNVISVEPIPGAAVFWYNLKKSGEADDRTLHGACPVLLGSKWVNKEKHVKNENYFALIITFVISVPSLFLSKKYILFFRGFPNYLTRREI